MVSLCGNVQSGTGLGNAEKVAVYSKQLHCLCPSYEPLAIHYKTHTRVSLTGPFCRRLSICPKKIFLEIVAAAIFTGQKPFLLPNQ